MYGGRAALNYKLNDSWSALLSGDFQSQSTHGAWDQDPSRYGARNVSRFGPESGERINRIMSLTVKGDVGIGDLIYAGGYWNRYNHTINEYSEYVQYANIQPNNTGYQTYAGYVQSFACATSSPSGDPTIPDSYGGCNVPTMFTNYHDTTEQWSHELRLSSKPGGSTHWTVGFYFQQTKDVYSDLYDYPGINFQGQAAQIAYSYYTGAAALPGEWYSYYNQRTDNHQIAGFGEITQDITSRWSVIFGFRDFKSRDSSSDQWSGYFYQPKLPTPTEEVSFTKQSYKAGVNFKYSDNTLFYASFAQGFRDGGFNTSAATNPGVPATYQPDTLNSYELGWKTVTWDGAIAVERRRLLHALEGLSDGGLRSCDLPGDLQRQYRRCENLRRGEQHRSQARAWPDAVAVGQLQRFGIDQHVVLAIPTTSPTVGQRLPFVPYYKGSATGRYEWPVGPNYNAYTQFDVSRTGDMWSDFNTSPLSTTTR